MQEGLDFCGCHIQRRVFLDSKRKTAKQKPVNKPQAEFFMVLDSNSAWVSALISGGAKLWPGSLKQINFITATDWNYNSFSLG